MGRDTVKFYKYIEKLYTEGVLSSPEPEKAAPGRLERQQEGRLLKMQLSEYEGRILRIISSLIKPKRILEIGTLFGYSAICLANSIKAHDEANSQFDHAEVQKQGVVITIDSNAEHLEIAKQNILNAGLSDIVKTVHGLALDKLDEIAEVYNLASEPLDIVFIDGMKSEYVQYLDFAKSYLRKGGLMIADNTLLFDSVLQFNSPEEIKDKKLKKMWLVMDKFNREVAEHFDSFIIPTDAGMSIGVKK